MNDIILHNHHHDHLDRRGFLKCMAWVGTGVLWTLSGGVLTSKALGEVAAAGGVLGGDATAGELSFVQISDTHIGFNKPANPDVVGTLREAMGRINALPVSPSFVLHTGDLSHLSEAEEFDTLEQELKSLKTGRIFYVPGEHDIMNDNGAQYLARFGKGTQGAGWYSFDQKGVHFIGLVNVMNTKEGGLGVIGSEQLAWLQKDLEGLSSSTPVVVFAHIPLWSIYPQWGWGTDDAAQALAMLKRFGSVTVLNGHIHQVMQKVEGNISFHTATSTSFPQPQPGTAPKAGPMLVEPGRLRSLLGITKVNYIENNHSLALVDSSLASN